MLFRMLSFDFGDEIALKEESLGFFCSSRYNTLRGMGILLSQV